VIELMRKNNHAAVVSGAGPSILVLASDPAERMDAVKLAAEHFPQWRALVLAVDFKGATVIRHQ
jgi:homoserine kinase